METKAELSLSPCAILAVVTPAAMVVSSDRCLVHAGDECRAARRADGRRHEGVSKENSFRREPIDVRRLDGRLAVTAEVVRHVLYHDPDDVWSR